MVNDLLLIAFQLSEESELLLYQKIRKMRGYVKDEPHPNVCFVHVRRDGVALEKAMGELQKELSTIPIKSGEFITVVNTGRSCLFQFSGGWLRDTTTLAVNEGMAEFRQQQEDVFRKAFSNGIKQSVRDMHSDAERIAASGYYGSIK